MAITGMTLCHECDRGGNGNSKDKCACGWQQVKPSALGCYIGTPIVGEPRKHDKASRSKQRYLHYLDVADCFESFRDFLRPIQTPEGRW
jgi:hypothetical protein